MIDRDVRPCPQHRGEPAHNCGPCRSERIGKPDENESVLAPVRERRPRELRLPRQVPAHLYVVPAERTPTENQ